MSSGARVAQEPQKIEDDVIGCACADHWLHMRSSWGPNPAATTVDNNGQIPRSPYHYLFGPRLFI